MSYHNDIIEAQFISSLHNELESLEKEASAAVTAVKGGVAAAKGAKGIGAALKGSKWLAKWGPQGWWKFTKSVPGRIAYRTTGYKGKGFEKLTKAQQAERMESMGVRGAKGSGAARTEMVEAAEKAKKGEGFLAGRKAKKVEELEKIHGGMENIPDEALAKAVGKQEALASAQAYEKGMTTIPGYLRHAALHPIETARIGWQAQGASGKAMTGAFGGWGAYNVAQAPPEERLKVLAEELPATALYALTGPVGMAGQLALADIPSSLVAKGVGKLAPKAAKKAPPTMTAPEVVRRAAAAAKPVGAVVPKPVAAVGEKAVSTAERVVPNVPVAQTARARSAARFAGHVLPPDPAAGVIK